LYPGATRREQGDDRGDDPLRRRDQPAHDPGVAGRAVPRHRIAPAGAGGGLARSRTCRIDRRARRADRAAALSASDAYRDIRVAGDLLQALLLPSREDRVPGRRDGEEPADDAPAPARRRRILPVPAPAGDGELTRTT